MSKIKTIVSDLQDMSDFNGFGDAQSHQAFRESLDMDLHLTICEFLREYRDEFMCQNDFVGAILKKADIAWDLHQESNKEQAEDNIPF